MKFFNTAGPVNRVAHYKIDPLHRWDLEEVLSLIQQEKYFVLHAPRQTGKTSCMLALQQYLNDTGDYNVIYLNVEIAQMARNDIERGIGAIISKLSRCVNNEKQQKRLMGIIDETKPDDAFNSALEYLSGTSDKPVVLLIDEIDSLIGDTLISVLRQIRASYEKRPHKFPVSLILCGVRDIKDYRIHSSRNEIITGGSCFNIKAKSLNLDNFSKDEVHKLLMKHTLETGQEFEDGVFDYIFEQTSGQPWLVNAVAYELTFEMKENRDHSVLLTTEMAKTAINQIIVSRSVHLDQLADKLKEDRVRRVILPMLLNSEEIAASDDDREYCVDLGLIKHSPKGLVVSNEIYKEIIPRELSKTQQDDFKMTFEPDWINADGSLNTTMLFEMFIDFWRTNSEIWSSSIAGYKEAAPHLVFQAFLQRVSNGNGTVRREYALGRKRLDLYLEWRQQRVIIELKILRENEKYKSVKELALKQTMEYSDKCNGTEEHIIIFDRDETRGWREKVFTDSGTYKGKKIKIWGC